VTRRRNRVAVRAKARRRASCSNGDTDLPSSQARGQEPGADRLCPSKPVGFSAAKADGRVSLEIRKSKAAFYNTVVAQAQKIEFGADRVTFSFLPTHRMLREQFEQNRRGSSRRPRRLPGKKMRVAAQAKASAEPVGAAEAPRPTAGSENHRDGDSAVQAMLDVFPAEIENVEEIE
jgi:hypothetical protein